MRPDPTLEKKNQICTGEARFSREMAAARGLIGDPAQARRDSPDPGRRHDGRGHILLPSSAPRGPRGC